MNESIISSPWFESLNTASQTALVVLATLVAGLTTYQTVRLAWNAGKGILRGSRVLWTSLHDAPEAPKAQPSVPPGELCRTLLHLLERFSPWSTAVAGDKEPRRFLTHTNGRVRIEFGEEIEYFLAGVDLTDDLTEAETALLDEAAVRCKDAVLASLAACGETHAPASHMSAADYQATLRGGTVLPPAPPVKR